MPDAVDLNIADTKGKKTKKQGGGMGRMLVLALAFVLAAGAAGLGAAVGIIRFGGDLLPGIGAGHEAPAAAAAKVAGPVTYAGIETAFTSNLVDTGRYLQVKISVGTTAGEAVTAAMKTHEPAVISAVLAVLGEASEIDVGSRQAKAALAVRVRDAINLVLRERGVAGAVDEVYFTSLVVQ